MVQLVQRLYFVLLCVLSIFIERVSSNTYKYEYYALFDINTLRLEPEEYACSPHQRIESDFICGSMEDPCRGLLHPHAFLDKYDCNCRFEVTMHKGLPVEKTVIVRFLADLTRDRWSAMYAEPIERDIPLRFVEFGLEARSFRTLCPTACSLRPFFCGTSVEGCGFNGPNIQVADQMDSDYTTCPKGANCPATHEAFLLAQDVDIKLVPGSCGSNYPPISKLSLIPLEVPDPDEIEIFVEIPSVCEGLSTFDPSAIGSIDSPLPIRMHPIDPETDCNRLFHIKFWLPACSAQGPWCQRKEFSFYGYIYDKKRELFPIDAQYEILNRQFAKVLDRQCPLVCEDSDPSTNAFYCGNLLNGCLDNYTAHVNTIFGTEQQRTNISTRILENLYSFGFFSRVYNLLEIEIQEL